MQVNFVNPPPGQSYKPGDTVAVLLQFRESPKDLTALTVHFDLWNDGKLSTAASFDLTNSQPTDQGQTTWKVSGQVPHVKTGDYKITSAFMTVSGASTTVPFNGLMVHVDADEPSVFPEIVDITHATNP